MKDGQGNAFKRFPNPFSFRFERGATTILPNLQQLQIVIWYKRFHVTNSDMI